MMERAHSFIVGLLVRCRSSHSSGSSSSSGTGSKLGRIKLSRRATIGDLLARALFFSRVSAFAAAHRWRCHFDASSTCHCVCHWQRSTAVVVVVGYRTGQPSLASLFLWPAGLSHSVSWSNGGAQSASLVRSSTFGLYFLNDKYRPKLDCRSAGSLVRARLELRQSRRSVAYVLPTDACR